MILLRQMPRRRDRPSQRAGPDRQRAILAHRGQHRLLDHGRELERVRLAVGTQVGVPADLAREVEFAFAVLRAQLASLLPQWLG